eukprot:COSAG02_NODE_2921_length_7747_cov_9.003400_2_plen_63_part_00
MGEAIVLACLCRVFGVHWNLRCCECRGRRKLEIALFAGRKGAAEDAHCGRCGGHVVGGERQR